MGLMDADALLAEKDRAARVELIATMTARKNGRRRIRLRRARKKSVTRLMIR